MTTNRFARLATAASALAVIAVPLAVSEGPASGSEAVLVLRDQRFFVSDTVELDYVLAGDSVTLAETTTSTTTPPIVAEPTATTTPDGAESTSSTSTTTSTVPIPTALPSDTAMVRVAVHRVVDDRFGVAASLTGDPGPIVDVLTVPLADVAAIDAADGRLTVNLRFPVIERVGPVPRQSDELEIVDTGLTPVSVSVMRNGIVVAEHTTIVDIGLSALTPAPMEFGIVAAIGGDDTVEGAATPSVVDETTKLLRVRAEVEALYGVLSTTTLPVMVAWSPSLIEALDEGGLTVGLDTSLIDLMDEMGELVALPDRRIDPSAATEAGLDDLFAAEVIAGVDRLAVTFPGTPVRRTVWFAHPAVTETSLTSAGARLLRTLGVQAVVLTWDAFTRYEGVPSRPIDTTLTAGLDLGGSETLPLLVVDPVSSLFDVDAATGSASPMDRAVRLLAEMTALRRVDPSLARRVMISGNDLTPPDPGAITALERLLTDDPAGVRDDPASVFAPTGDRNGITISWSGNPDIDLATRRLVLQAVLDNIDDVASMLPADDPRPDQWRASVFDLYESRVTVARFDADVAAVNAGIASVRSAVVLPTSGTFTLTGRDSPLPLQIENTSDTSLSVLVRIESAKLEVPPDPIPITLDPGTTVVRLAVAARANGTFPVLVEVLSPRGQPVVEATTVTARANSVTGLGRLVAVGLVLVLISWWYSHFRKRRRTRTGHLAGTPGERRPSGSGSDAI